MRGPKEVRWQVHLTGGEGIGWALDADLGLTRLAMERVSGMVELTDAQEADVIHSVWPLTLRSLGDRLLSGKRVLCHIPNDPYEFSQSMEYLVLGRRVGLWIAMTGQAGEKLTALGLRNAFVPYGVDTTVFDGEQLKTDNDVILKARHDLGIASGTVVIGSFHRDTLGSNLAEPKTVKGPDIFLAIVRAAAVRGVPVLVLLAGPRRHWIRAALSAHSVPYLFVGKDVPDDDMRINTLTALEMRNLYRLLDLYLVSSRAEGGPRTVLEAAAMKVPVLSTPVSLATDVLSRRCIYTSVDEAVELIIRHRTDNFLRETVEDNYRRAVVEHNVEACAARLRQVYKDMEMVPPFSAAERGNAARRTPVTPVSGPIRRAIGRLTNLCGIPVRRRLTLGIWYDFRKPPYGGGNQFFLALRKWFIQHGVDVRINSASRVVDVHLVNSTWFDRDRFERLASRRSLKIVHRIDGPTALVRGTDDWAADDYCFEINARYASATVLQSNWSLKKTLEMGYTPVNPRVIFNAVDESVFHPHGRPPLDRNKPVRIIGTSWSDNPRKGGAVYKWLEGALNWKECEFTFVGRTQESFDRIKHLPPVDSHALADLLRQSDIYVTASQCDPCSNALIEAMACGLPILYYDDGGHPELVGYGGLPFSRREEIIPQLRRLVDSYELFQSVLSYPRMDNVASAYLEVAREVLG